MLLAPSYSSTSSTLKDFPITPQNEETWNAFLKKVESSLKINSQEFLTGTEDAVEKLWRLLESRMNGDRPSFESIDAEVQVDVKVSNLYFVSIKR